jgi:hypothetical protein
MTDTITLKREVVQKAFDNLSDALHSIGNLLQHDDPKTWPPHLKVRDDGEVSLNALKSALAAPPERDMTGELAELREFVSMHSTYESSNSGATRCVSCDANVGLENPHKAGCFVARTAANAPQPEPLVRYCPDCGSIGPVPATARDCCPDGGHARMVPENFAKLCRETFLRAIGRAQPVQSPPLTDTQVIAIADSTDKDRYGKQTDTPWLIDFARAIETAIAAPQPVQEPAHTTREDGMPASKTERTLRRMLCAQRHGPAAYMDDGEASWGGDDFQRGTDYMRETPEAIQQAWMNAGRKQLAAPQPVQSPKGEQT